MSCGKDFTEKRFLNDHMQTAHSGNDGPLKCPNCFREFAYKTSLKQHLKKQMCAKNLNRGQPNQNQNQANSGNQGNSGNVHAKQFACPFCEKSYSWKQTLKQVIRREFCILDDEKKMEFQFESFGKFKENLRNSEKF